MSMKLFSTEGRVNRGPYFWHTSLDGIVILTLILGVYLLFELTGLEKKGGEVAAVIQTILTTSIATAGLISEICVTARRFHDLGRSGWHVLLCLIPFYNVYLFIILLFKEGDRGPNEYGPDPLRRIS